MFVKIAKVWTFREAHKIWKNLPHCLDVYSVNAQSMRKIAQIFCAQKVRSFSYSASDPGTYNDETLIITA